MYLYLLLFLFCINTQASDLVKKLDRSYDALITADVSTVDIDNDAQIILPVSHGQSITVPLDTEDVFAYDSIRSMIKEVGGGRRLLCSCLVQIKASR